MVYTFNWQLNSANRGEKSSLVTPPVGQFAQRCGCYCLYLSHLHKILLYFCPCILPLFRSSLIYTLKHNYVINYWCKRRVWQPCSFSLPLLGALSSVVDLFFCILCWMKWFEDQAFGNVCFKMRNCTQNIIWLVCY